MAKVTYTPDEGMPSKTEQYGYSFGADPVEVTDEKHLGKFRGNRFFSVEDAPVEAKPGIALVAKSKGFGNFSIVRGSETVVEGLKKPDADQFNALNDADKEAYVAAALEAPAQPAA